MVLDALKSKACPIKYTFQTIIFLTKPIKSFQVMGNIKNS